MKILIADDDKTSRNILAVILKKTGHDVIAVDNGIKALEIMRQPNPPEIIILDWIMPEMNGIDVCRAIRALDSFIKPYIIMLTKLDKKENIIMALKDGADDYVTKPFDLGELTARIHVAERIIDMQIKLINAANTDALTGLPNRNFINISLEKELSRTSREGGVIGVAMLDLDHFKNINDTYGHKTGDDVLVWFADKCKQNLRKYDIIGRYGGEEFIIIAPKKYESNQPWNRVLEAINSGKFKTKTSLIKLTVSIGVAYNNGEDSWENVINNADKALYRAKYKGRNRIEYADSSNIHKYNDILDDLNNDIVN